MNVTTKKWLFTVSAVAAVAVPHIVPLIPTLLHQVGAPAWVISAIGAGVTAYQAFKQDPADTASTPIPSVQS